MNAGNRHARLKLPVCPSCGLDSGERMIAPGPPERHTVRCGSCGCRTKFYSRSCDAVKAWGRGDVKGGHDEKMACVRTVRR